MMSNAKLKEQIEAAKIALVHSAEASTFANKSPASGNLTPSPSIGVDHAQPHGDSAAHTDTPAHIDNVGQANSIADMPHSPLSAETQIVGQEMIAQSDFKKLESRCL